jgi:hypothetical protein
MAEEQRRLTRNLNDALPYDILSIIFNIYAQWDGMNDPLEKLLCICKTWSTAAIQHKRLWTSFRISSSSPNELRFWCSRVSGRIKRSGDENPIDLRIIILPYRIAGERAYQEKIFGKLLQALMGREACLVKRWRRVYILRTPPVHQWIWDETLSSPTPNLTSLTIHDLDFKKPILPFAPRLQEFIATDCSFELSGNLGQLKMLRIEAQGKDTQINAENLTTLELVDCYTFTQLPSMLPALENFTLKENVEELEWKNVCQFSAPRLRNLKLHLYGYTYKEFLAIPHRINLERLESLQLSTHVSEFSSTKNRAISVVVNIKETIQAAKKVKQFTTKGKGVLRILLACIREGFHSETLLRGCTLRAKWIGDGNCDMDMTFKLGPRTMAEDIHHICISVKLPQDEAWGALAENLFKSGWDDVA